MLKLNNIEVLYQNTILVLKGVSLEVPDGHIIGVLGANGAGKTTALKAISALLKDEEGKVTDGSIEFDGKRIDYLDPTQIVKMGIVQVMEGRRVLEHMTVEQNLRVGAHLSPDRIDGSDALEKVFGYFSRLKALRRQAAGWLSGGEQQMLVLGRAMMARPKLLLLDEPSFGLAPRIVNEVYQILLNLNQKESITMLLVEQNAKIALETASYAYVLENGRVVLDGPCAKLKENEDIKEFYLGLSQIGKRKSYKDVKHYKRRKRWLG